LKCNDFVVWNHDKFITWFRIGCRQVGQVSLASKNAGICGYVTTIFSGHVEIPYHKQSVSWKTEMSKCKTHKITYFVFFRESIKMKKVIHEKLVKGQFECKEQKFTNPKL
jgi:hypothetical protein